MIGAIDTASIEDVRLPPEHLHIMAHAERRLTAAVAGATARQWVIAGGIRVCVEALDEVLEWVRRQAALWHLTGSITRNEDGRLHLEAKTTGEVRISRVLDTLFHGKWTPRFAGNGHPVSRVMATPSDRSSAAPA